MRRRWVIVAAILAVLIAGGAFVYLRLPRAPFAFLKGHEPLVNRLTPAQSKRHFGAQSAIIYSFQADSDRLLADAAAELKTLGYSVNKETWIGDLYFERGKSKGLIIKDTRLDELSHEFLSKGGSLEGKGWVTVLISEQDAAWWERIKAVFGL